MCQPAKATQAALVPPVDNDGMAIAEDTRTARRVVVGGIVASALLSTMNLVTGVTADSRSVFATGLEFAGDVMASTMVLLGMMAAAKPADDNHPYGHGRLESLVAFVVGLVLVSGGVGIAWTSLQAISAVHPPPGAAAIVALVIAMIVRGVFVGLKASVGRRLGSAAILADAWNDAVDILSAGAALTAVVLARWQPDRFQAADHYGGALVGMVVTLTGLRVLRDATLELIDTMPNPALMGHLRATALGVPGVLGVDKAYARKTGLRYHVDLHVEVAPDLTVSEAHAVAGHVRQHLRAEIGWVADVLVHVEPAPR